MNKGDIKSGIYCLENSVNGKRYVGQAENLEKRKREHGYKDRSKGCHALRNAFEKYGYDNFIHSVVEECAIEDLDEREIFWIKELHSHVSEWGYNISWGGNTPQRGRKHTEDEKRRIGESQPRKYGKDHPNFGKPFTEEHRKRIGDAQRGRPSKIKGRKWTPEQMKKYKESRKYYKGEENPLYGRKSSPEHIEKVRLKHANKRYNDKKYDSKYPGIKISPYGKWLAHSCSTFLGSFYTETEAAMAINEFLLEEFGWKIKDKLNIIPEEDLKYIWNLPVEEKNNKIAFLNNEQVLKIRKDLLENKYTLKEIGEMYGVSYQVISGIKHNRTYKNIKELEEGD